MGQSPDPGDVIRAAGVVLLRQASAATEVLIVHSKARGDWSLPKGKLEPSEHPAVAAVRECDEETGLQVILGPALRDVSYPVDGRPKIVTYWSAVVREDPGFTPDDEVDAIDWVPVEQMSPRLRFAGEHAVVHQAMTVPPTLPLVVLRHARAVKRADFKGSVDAERPLTGIGRTQAKGLVPLLEAYGIAEVVSSDAARCFQTVRKFAKAVDKGIQREHALSEEGHAQDPGHTAHQARLLARRPAPLLLCTHRPVLPTVLGTIADALGADASDPDWDPRLRPGGCLVIHRRVGPDGSLGFHSIERHELFTD
ncbi:MAG: NUDIX domain-containing protein [Actinomycetales bacterium]|nr:NUDIX domain-containing protein [Actinomycetales bacterium]